MIVTVLWTVHLLGGALTSAASAAAVKLPACGMACCVKNVCECVAAPADSPKAPPAVPLAPKPTTKFVPALLALLPVAAAEGMTHAVLPPAGGRTWNAQARPIFRLHCALLM